MTFEYKPEEYKYVKQEREKAIQKLEEQIDKQVDELGINEIGLIERLKKRALKKIMEGSEKEYLSFDFGKTAYNHQLDTYCKPTESINYAYSVVCPEADEDWLKKAKNDRYGFNEVLMNILLKEKEDYFSSLPDSININNLKKDVGKSRSLNQGLRKLHGYQKIEKEIEELKLKDLDKERRIQELEMKLSMQNSDLRVLKDSVGIAESTPKDKAKVLKIDGYTIRQISECLGVSESTIKRWTSSGSR